MECAAIFLSFGAGGSEGGCAPGMKSPNHNPLVGAGSALDSFLRITLAGTAGNFGAKVIPLG